MIDRAAMAKIVIYTTRTCSYCFSAKSLLARKGAAFDEIDVSHDPAGRQHMTERAGGVRTVPQIFIDGTHVGGRDELYELEIRGQLDPLLTAS